MRHPRNLCSLQFAPEKALEKHVASFHTKPDARRSQPILPVVLEKIKIEPELIRLDEEDDDDDDDDQTTSTVQKQPPKAMFEKHGIPQIVKRSKQKDSYQCKVCLEKFPLLRYFRKHLANAEKQGLFKCEEYYKTNNTVGYLPLYNKSSTKGIDTAKVVQTTKTEQSQGRQRTTEIFPTIQDASCKACRLTCVSHEQLCVHYSKHHNLPAVLLKHIDEHELYQKYKQHVESIRTHNSFKYDTSGENNFSNHSGICHKCNICKRQFSSPTMFRKHKLAVHNDKEVSRNDVNHRKVKLISTPKIDGVRQKCEICLKEFKHRRTLNQHKLTAHDGVRHKCKSCPKMFAQSGQLKQHIQTVHDGVRHKCISCPKAFTQLSYLSEHKRSAHDGVRHKCESCPKAFTRLGYLHQHKRSAHDGFCNTCGICQKNFCASGYLKQHKITVHHV